MLLDPIPNCRFASQGGTVAQREQSVVNNTSWRGNHQQIQLEGEAVFFPALCLSSSLILLGCDGAAGVS